MGMRYETIKTAILTILVCLSVLLTWNLWTFQPDYGTMQKNNTVAEVTMSEKQEVQKIIKPDMVVYNKESKYYGTNRTDELDKLIKELSSWKFSNIRVSANKTVNISDLSQMDGNVEIIFPAEVPVGLYREVLNFDQKKMPSFTFDRIIIDTKSLTKNNGIVYFTSSGNQYVYRSQISSKFLKDFNQKFYKDASRYPSYFSYNISDKRTIFLPDDPTEMMVYKYLPVTLNSGDFKNALFNDPNFVQTHIYSSGEDYTNGSSKLSINYKNNILLYVNPMAAGYYVENSNSLVKRSIDFVNEHGGWPDTYHYAAEDAASHHVIFRMYSDEGYPVFNEDGLSEISETLGKNDITRYKRSNISLDIPLKTETQKVTRPSGHTVLQYIESQSGFQPALFQNAVLGYEMERDPNESKLILLEPVWFYQYNNKWIQLPLEKTEGDE
jgi:regulatory protein YycH of two-component signal transduction system YycFG